MRFSGTNAGCAVVTPWSSIIIGASAGVIYVVAAKFIDTKLKIDDPLEAGAVHCICGIWGPIMAAAFAKQEYVRQVYGDETADNGHGTYHPRLREPLPSSQTHVLFF